jgi:hypothetical protein
LISLSLSAAEVEAEIITLIRGEESHKGTGFLRVHGAPDDPLGIEYEGRTCPAAAVGMAAGPRR